MQNKKAQKKNQSKKQHSDSEFETFALSGGKKNPKSGTTVPPEEGVIAAKEFIEENKK